MKKPILATYCTNRAISMLTEEDIRAFDVLYFAFVRVDKTTADISELTNLDKMAEIRRINPNIKIVLTAASGTEGGFPAGTSDEATARELAKTMCALVREFDFDGLDIDWEYPTPEQAPQHTLLLKTLREELDLLETADRHYTLSIAAGCKTWYFGITELGESVKYLDYVNLMTYDINANNPYTMHHCCPYPMDTDKETEGSTKENIDVFVKNGVPAEKIIVGAAFYSRQWKNVKNENNGLHAYAGTPSDYGPGYTGLVRDYVNKNGYTRYWDDTAKAPYLFNGDNFITYDDEESLRHKCALVKETGIAGIMIWEYSYDEEHVLVKIMREAL